MAFELRIGSRPSPLAIAQATIVKGQLESALPGLKVEIVPITSGGDRMQTASLAQIGGKGLFIKELEEALGARHIDVAVHSMKDLPARLATPYRIIAVPVRENPRDALITRAGKGLARLPKAARVGTSSTRRCFQALHLRPDLTIEPLRGNVDTRLRRLVSGDLDGIIVAVAGLRRLGRSEVEHLEELDERRFVPAGGQGALAIETLADGVVGNSAELEDALAGLNDDAAASETDAERTFLAGIGASCVSPVGVNARLQGHRLAIRAQIFSPDGSRLLEKELTAHVDKNLRPAAAGQRLAEQMLAGGASELMGGV